MDALFVCPKRGVSPSLMIFVIKLAKHVIKSYVLGGDQDTQTNNAMERSP